MPLANGFLDKDEFKSEYFFEMEVGFSEDLSLFQLNDHPKPEKMFSKKYPFYTGSSELMKLHFKKYADWIKSEFLKSANKIFQNPENLTNALFQIRADDLINSMGPVIYKSRLSGYLLGIELLGAKDFWENCDVALIGSKKVMDLYENLLEDKVLSLKKFSAEEMVLQGLKTFRKNLMKS